MATTVGSATHRVTELSRATVYNSGEFGGRRRKLSPPSGSSRHRPPARNNIYIYIYTHTQRARKRESEIFLLCSGVGFIRDHVWEKIGLMEKKRHKSWMNGEREGLDGYKERTAQRIAHITWSLTERSGSSVSPHSKGSTLCAQSCIV